MKKGSTEEFFEGLDRRAVVEAIRAAEEKGLGEIRVHLQRGRVADPKAEAEKVFVRLGMAKTEAHTGCLVFIAPDERAFAVIGDKAINERVGPDFWLDARDAASHHFTAGRFTEGIVAAVEKLGDALARHFPRKAGVADVNELSNEVTEGE